VRTISSPVRVIPPVMGVLSKIDLHKASHVDHNPTPSLDKLRVLADGAYEDRKQRMANAWRN
jgi:hypothetical protein